MNKISQSKFIHPKNHQLFLWERHLSFILSLGLILFIIGFFIATPKYGLIFSEYIIKHLPAFTDNPLSKIFDFNNVGDSRGHIIKNLMIWINIHFRRILLLYTVIHPSLSFNWVIYPTTLYLFYKAICLTSNNKRLPIMATLLYASSPGMLGILLEYYLPGKALVNLFFSLGFYGISLAFTVLKPSRPYIGTLLFIFAFLMGLLSDETAIFIPLSLIYVLAKINVNRLDTTKITILLSGLLITIFLYVTTLTLIIPLINNTLNQSPLQIFDLIFKGPYYNFGNLIKSIRHYEFYDPLNLFQVIFSSHYIPNRIAPPNWVSSIPFPNFLAWSSREKLAYLAYLITFLCFFITIEKNEKINAGKIAFAFFIYLFVQEFLIIFTNGYLQDISYYAAISSFFLSLLVAHIAANSVRNINFILFAWVWVVCIIASQITNFMAGEERYPYFGKNDLTWHDLNDIRNEVISNQNTWKGKQFFDRRFSYAFETAAALDSAKDVKIDFQPLENPDLSLSNSIKFPPYFQDQSLPKFNFGNSSFSELDMKKIGAILVGKPTYLDYFSQKILYSHLNEWNFKWQFDELNNVTQLSWRPGLMRVFTDKGIITKRDDEVCVIIQDRQVTCFFAIYKYKDVFYAFDKNGSLVIRFKLDLSNSN
ncbi:hypothetical protein [Polynucleobacter sp. IMCC 30228]|uniref:hypothetical protein n=1 Tax=Polynucleobacter sp. IMCC 30228 TaxID=2781011 RepID=UPI001F24B72A|nr:hypothetical protein [Polynucleobacter sp. IMCC 30228]MCE7527861.1 hypothetical protein [Polynucleobacter sp. IMCC 30228]